MSILLNLLALGVQAFVLAMIYTVFGTYVLWCYVLVGALLSLAIFFVGPQENEKLHLMTEVYICLWLVSVWPVILFCNIIILLWSINNKENGKK